MNCTKCGSPVRPGDKFCGNCGSATGGNFCTGCGKPVNPGAAFCTNCGKSLQATGQTPPPYDPPPAPPITNTSAAESVIMDTGVFPVAYVRNIMSSINGKLSLTGHHLIFKAGHLQGVGGIAVGGVFIPNASDSNASKEHFAIPLSSISSVEKGWSHITVISAGQRYKFSGMTKTSEWETAINQARG